MNTINTQFSKAGINPKAIILMLNNGMKNLPERKRVVDQIKQSIDVIQAQRLILLLSGMPCKPSKLERNRSKK